MLIFHTFIFLILEFILLIISAYKRGFLVLIFGCPGYHTSIVEITTVRLHHDNDDNDNEPVATRKLNSDHGLMEMPSSMLLYPLLQCYILASSTCRISTICMALFPSSSVVVVVVVAP